MSLQRSSMTAGRIHQLGRCHATLASFWTETGAMRVSKASVSRVKSTSVAPESLMIVLNWSAELYIPAVTLWVFSTENLKRSSSEDWCLSFGFGLRTVQRWCALRPSTAHLLIHATMGPIG
jgi:hypothetical protein